MPLTLTLSLSLFLRAQWSAPALHLPSEPHFSGAQLAASVLCDLQEVRAADVLLQPRHADLRVDHLLRDRRHGLRHRLCGSAPSLSHSPTPDKGAQSNIGVSPPGCDRPAAGLVLQLPCGHGHVGRSAPQLLRQLHHQLHHRYLYPIGNSFTSLVCDCVYK